MGVIKYLLFIFNFVFVVSGNSATGRGAITSAEPVSFPRVLKQ